MILNQITTWTWSVFAWKSTKNVQKTSWKIFLQKMDHILCVDLDEDLEFVEEI